MAKVSIEQAIKNGAVKVIVEHGNYSVETVVVENTREYLKDILKVKLLIKIFLSHYLLK